jgi:hypothetical protein
MAAFELHFNGNWNLNDGIVRFTVSDWAWDGTDRKTQGGHVFLTCCDGGDISCQSQEQDLIALSTLDADYIACSETS